MWTKGTGMTVRWKMHTEDGSVFDETVQWDHLFELGPTNSMKSFVRRRAEIETVTGYFHDFSTFGWAAHAPGVILRIWKFKNKRSPIVGSDCKWLGCQFHHIVRWPRPDLAQHCSAAAPRRASACLHFFSHARAGQSGAAQLTSHNKHTLCYTAVWLPAHLRTMLERLV